MQLKDLKSKDLFQLLHGPQQSKLYRFDEVGVDGQIITTEISKVTGEEKGRSWIWGGAEAVKVDLVDVCLLHNGDQFFLLTQSVMLEVVSMSVEDGKFMRYKDSSGKFHLCPMNCKVLVIPK